MALEVACSKCGGRLLIADPETVVACPHCGAELSVAESSENAFAGLSGLDAGGREWVPDFSALAAPPDDGNVDEVVVGPSAESGVAAAASESVVTSSLDGIARDVSTVADTGSSVLTAHVLAGAASRSDVLPETTETGSDLSRLQFGAAPPTTNGSDVLLPQAASPTEPSVQRTTAQSEPARATAPPGVSRLVFMLLLSYASAVTLFLAYLLYVVRFGEPHPLESLPDIVPNYRETLPDVEPVTDRNGRVLPQIVAEDAEMPVGHTLRLGEARRFGNVRVTPLKVTREMLHFEHYSGDLERTNPPVGPVLKLWLRFENVSNDQRFAPLDRPLLYFRGQTSRESFQIRSNHFVAKAGEKRSESTVLVYDLVLDGEWDPRNQSLGSAESSRLLQPGEELVTYIPTQPDGIDELTGQLIWRVHFRKGYNPESGRGVTTLIEVDFDSDAIETAA